MGGYGRVKNDKTIAGEMYITPSDGYSVDINLFRVGI